MNAFPPLLYAYVGANLRFDLPWQTYLAIARSLSVRWIMCGAVAYTGRQLWPVDEATRGVMTLCVVAPVAASMVFYTAKYSYPMEQTSLLFNLSAVVSLIVMSLIAPVA